MYHHFLDIETFDEGQNDEIMEIVYWVIDGLGHKIKNSLSVDGSKQAYIDKYNCCYILLYIVTL